MHTTLPLLGVTDFPVIHRFELDTLQVNLGYRCNQTCVHCHANAGPNRKEMMDHETIALVPEVIKVRRIKTLDLTGGAPELHEGLRDMVSVDWQGYPYDCDFNQMPGLTVPGREFKDNRPHLYELIHNDPEGMAIKVADHCVGCTAGSGSSCNGAIAGH